MLEHNAPITTLKKTIKHIPICFKAAGPADSPESARGSKIFPTPLN